jgi:hypothetical protein
MICLHFIYTQVAPYIPVQHWSRHLDTGTINNWNWNWNTHPPCLCKKRKSWKPSNFHGQILLVWSPSEGKVSLKLCMLVWHGLTCLHLQIPLVCWRKPKPTILNPVGNWFYYRNLCNSYAVPKTHHLQICSLSLSLYIFENRDSGLW